VSQVSYRALLQGLLPRAPAVSRNSFGGNNHNPHTHGPTKTHLQRTVPIHLAAGKVTAGGRAGILPEGIREAHDNSSNSYKDALVGGRMEAKRSEYSRAGYPPRCTHPARSSSEVLTADLFRPLSRTAQTGSREGRHRRHDSGMQGTESDTDLRMTTRTSTQYGDTNIGKATYLSHKKGLRSLRACGRCNTRRVTEQP
jgi:hypothetical protein